jgi:hypothetical protein
MVYGVAGGIGIGSTRAGTEPRPSAGLAALGSLFVGLAPNDLVELAVRVDAGTVGSDGLGVLGAHLAVFPGGNRPGPVGDLSMFLDLGIGGSLSPSTGTPGPTASKTSITGVGRVGVAWERWRSGRVAFGPFLAGEAARGGDHAQAAALAGMAASFLPAGK